MKTLILCLLLSDSTAHKNLGFTAKEARILAENSLTNTQQKVYDFVKSAIYQEAEKRKLGVIVLITKSRFGQLYDWRTSGQVWTECEIVSTRLKNEGYDVTMAMKGSEIFFIINW